MVVFDSSIFVDDLRSARHSARIAGMQELVRTSSVVLSELWRGVTTKEESAFLRILERQYPVLTPTERNWIESGEILGRMHRDHGFEAGKLRALHFDVLIALTVRSHGARLITSNRADFELIREYREFRLEIW
jgi:predicted nucleic acid-binding protein